MSQQQPIVSILMTAYNREKYIACAIESVLASTYTDFELIITDDQSNDKTVEIAQQFAGKDQRVKIFVNEHNLGDYPNRNMAASYARGKYLKYVDADDYIYPWGLQHLVEMMEQFPEAGWGLCSLEQNFERPFPFMLSPKEAYHYNYTGPGLFHKAPLSSIIKKEAFDAVGGFATIRMAGDFEMWHRLSQKFPVVLMPHGIVWYREHHEQEMNNYRKYLEVYEIIKLKYLLQESCPLDRTSVKIVIKQNRYLLKKGIFKGLLTLNKNLVLDNLIKLKVYKNV